MNLSLNEVDALTKKAVRGAGFAWGLAEEGGKAARWLSRNGICGCQAIANLLTALPVKDADCVLTAGTQLADYAQKLTDNDREFSELASPILILPFAAMAARTLTTAVTVQIGEHQFTTDGTGLVAKDLTSLPAYGPISVRRGGDTSGMVQTQSRATPAPAALQVVMDFAHRTYAPATEESRLLGAGAGVTDND